MIERNQYLSKLISTKNNGFQKSFLALEDAAKHIYIKI